MGWNSARGQRQKSRSLPGYGTTAGNGDPRQQERPEPAPEAQPTVKRKGRDTDIWHLAELFRQYAQADGIELRKGLPVICTEINDLVDRHDMRAKAKAKRYRQAIRACTKRKLPASLAEKCWLHHLNANEYLTWAEMVEVIMAEFWSRIWDEHALDYFRQYFAEYGQLAMTHWDNLRVAERAEARRQEDARATMTADSKEG